jgi:hypothetical protein
MGHDDNFRQIKLVLLGIFANDALIPSDINENLSISGVSTSL